MADMDTKQAVEEESVAQATVEKQCGNKQILGAAQDKKG